MSMVHMYRRDVAVRLEAALLDCTRAARFIPIVLLGVAPGCLFWSTPPPDSVEFADVQALTALDGVYRNVGEGGASAFPITLSALIWPREQVDHKAIETVEVRAVDADTLVVRGHGAAGVIHESRFVAGRDFQFDHGRLRIMQSSALLNQAPDDPLVGPRTEVKEIGLDLGGSGKYRGEFHAVGLVYLFLPVAMNITEEARFPKVAP